MHRGYSDECELAPGRAESIPTVPANLRPYQAVCVSVGNVRGELQRSKALPYNADAIAEASRSGCRTLDRERRDESTHAGNMHHAIDDGISYNSSPGASLRPVRPPYDALQ